MGSHSINSFECRILEVFFFKRLLLLIKILDIGLFTQELLHHNYKIVLKTKARNLIINDMLYSCKYDNKTNDETQP